MDGSSRRFQHAPNEANRRMLRMLDEAERLYTPLRPRDQVRLEQLRRAQHEIHEREVRKISSPRPKKRSGLHPVVFALVDRNLLHAAETGDLELALDELRKLVWLSELPKRSLRGRPPLLTLEERLEAKRLRDKGWSYGKIGKQLGHPPSRIGAALRHHYPQKKSR